MFNDSISDLLTRIRNANTARKRNIVMPYAKITNQVAEILKANGYLESVKVTKNGNFQALEITLPESQSVITSLIRVSKPGRRVYTSAQDIPLVLGGRGLVIVSTSGGVMTGKEAKKRGLGGELICKVW